MKLLDSWELLSLPLENRDVIAVRNLFYRYVIDVGLHPFTPKALP